MDYVCQTEWFFQGNVFFCTCKCVFVSAAAAQAQVVVRTGTPRCSPHPAAFPLAGCVAKLYVGPHSAMRELIQVKLTVR